MSTRNLARTIRLLSLALLAAAPLPGAAQDQHGEVNIGAGTINLDNGNARYGEYTGIKDDDTFLVADVAVAGGKDKNYLDLKATDLGLDSRRLDIEAGEYGTYRFGYTHNESPHLVSTNAATIFDGVGTATLPLLSGFVKGANTSAMTIVSQPLDLKTQRDADSLRFAATFKNDWTAGFAYRHEAKEGLQSLGGTVGPNGGTTAGTMLPQPVDYRTDDLQVSIAYATEARQFEATYRWSAFTNDIKALTWEVPYTNASFPTNTGAPNAGISLPPDNEHQRLSLSGGIDLARAARLTAVAEYSKMTQDETLLPYTVDSAIATTALPRASAQAEVDVAHVTLNLATRPAPRLALNARYRYYKTDNKTPPDSFQRVINDAGAQVAVDSSQDTYNVPFDYDQNVAEITGAYRFGHGTHANLGYKYDVTRRSNRAVAETREQTVSAKLSKQLSERLSGDISYARAERGGDNYDQLRTYTAHHTAAYVASQTLQFDNHPDMRQFDIAKRDRDVYGATLDFAATEATDISMHFSRSSEEYRDAISYSDTYLGITANDGTIYGVDVSHAPQRGLTLYASYTVEDLEMSQVGREYRGFAKAADTVNAARNWWADHKDDIDTLGLGASLDLMADRLVLRLGYTLAHETNNIRFRAGTDPSVANPVDMPEENTTRQTVDVDGSYALRENVALELGIQYEKFDTSDWSRDNLAPASADAAEVLALEGAAPDYKAYLVTASIRYRW